MPRFSITVDDDLNEFIEHLAGEDGPHPSKSKAAAQLLDDARTVWEAEHDLDELLDAAADVEELQEDLDQLRGRLDDREERISELEDQLRRRSQVEEKVDVLANQVEDYEDTLNAPFFVRWARWFRSRGREAEA